MKMFHGRKHWIIWFSFFIALLLQIMPWPNEIVVFKPNWIFLILLYWILVLPYYINIFTGFLIGLILDLMNGCTLGIHALAMSVTTYLVFLKLQLFRSFSLWHQALVVTLLSFILDIIVFFVEFLIINIPFRLEIIWNAITNGVLWPWLFLIMNRIYHKFIL